jgi:hypothetical protein
MAKVLRYSTYGILFLWLQIGTQISLYLKGNCMYLCWIERATYTPVSFVMERYTYLTTSETKETQRCGLLQLACLWDMWVLGLGTLQRDDSNYCYFLCCNIYIHYDQPNGWQVNESWVCFSIMEFLIMKCYLHLPCLELVWNRESQSLYALKRLELTQFLLCAFSIFACKRK